MRSSRPAEPLTCAIIRPTSAAFTAVLVEPMESSKTLIVDDDGPARPRLTLCLRREPDIEIVGTARDGLEAVKQIRALSPELIFLDVRMPHLDGFGVINQIGIEAMPPTIFVTAYDEHAIKAIESHALDYLLK